MSDSEQSLSMTPSGSTGSGYRVIMDYKDDYHQFGMEIRLETFIEAVAHVLRSLPESTRNEVLQKLNEVNYERDSDH